MEDFVSLKEGDVIIQNGANSMVGTALLQIANARNIKTINIIRQRPDHDVVVEKLKKLGGYMVVTEDYVGTPDFKRLISDLPVPKLALNCVGGSSATEMARTLAPGGTLVTYGGMSKKPVTIPTSLFIFKDIQLKGFWMTTWVEQHSQQEKEQMLNSLYTLIRNNQLKLWIEKWNFNKFSQALQRSREPYRDSKVLLTMD